MEVKKNQQNEEKGHKRGNCSLPPSRVCYYVKARVQNINVTSKHCFTCTSHEDCTISMLSTDPKCSEKYWKNICEMTSLAIQEFNII